MAKPYKYEVFTHIIEQQILNGTLRAKDRLPSVREIRSLYKLSMTSVQNGFEYLVMKGLVMSSPRSGYFVREVKDENIPDIQTRFSLVIRDESFMKNMILTSQQTSDVSSFNHAVPGDLLIPQKLILRTMQEVIREKGATLLRYYPSNGLELLRRLIAQQMAKYSCTLNPDELIITDGALQALTIALRSVTAAGDIVAVESPCVFSVLEVLSSLGLRVVEIPVHYRHGFDVEYFRKICTEHHVRALIVTPNFHNPTGILMKDEVKKELLAIAGDHQMCIIENDMYSDLYFGEERPRCIKSFDTNGIVMMYSSFSKTLAPRIRLGWLYAGEWYSRSERVRFVLGRSVSPVYQELVLKLLQGSSYERHLRTFRKKLEEQATRVLDVVRRSFPEGSYFHRPEGGYSIWGQLPEGVPMEKFWRYCDRHQILFTPGYTFSFADQYPHHFRIIFAERISSESIALLEKAGAKVHELLVGR